MTEETKVTEPTEQDAPTGEVADEAAVQTVGELLDEGFTEQFWTDPKKEEEGVPFEDPVYGYKFTLAHRQCRKAQEYYRRRTAPFAAVVAGNRAASMELARKVEEEILARVLVKHWEPFRGPDGVIECPEDDEKRKEVALKFIRDPRMRRMRQYLDGCAQDDSAFIYESPRDKQGEQDLDAG